MNQIAYTVRMPDELRKAVRMAAAAEDKSMNQWIVDVLKEKTQKEDTMTSTQNITQFLANAIQNGEYDEEDGSIFFCSDEDFTQFELGTNWFRAFILVIGPEEIQSFTTSEAIDEAIRDGLLNEVSPSDPNNILVAQSIDPRTNEIVDH